MERDLIIAEETQSAVSWPAIFAGAATALAVSFVLLAVAAGFGLQLASPWPGAGGSFDNFNPTLGAILVAIQVLSAAFGGYLAGRLRTTWVDVHTHEIHFRDTAHGLLVWAVSTIAGVLLALALAAPATGHMAAQIAAGAGTIDPAALQAQTDRAASIAAQASLFMGVGLLLSAFIAAVAAGVGGHRRDEMHTVYWTERGRVRT